MTKIKNYDVVIIGAGLGGLVCGCYLAKKGLDVLIVEKNFQPGGYCTSFKRKNFKFDACAHSLGGFRQGGILRKLFDDLDLVNEIRLNRHTPSDIIVTPDFKINFDADSNKTIREFQRCFPDESKNISSFFNFLSNSSNESLFKLRYKPFKVVLDEFFKNNKLKSILSFPLLGNAGLPSSLISSFSATLLYREFLLDGGYYPEGGMQSLSNNLAKKFIECGGNLLLSNSVSKIVIKDKKAVGVEFAKGNFVTAKHVVSNCDAMQTFFSLIENCHVGHLLKRQLRKMIPSLSMFILYLGLSKNTNVKLPACSNIWYLPYYNVEKMYRSAKRRKAKNLAEFMIRVLPEKRSLMVFVNANFENHDYWEKAKDEMTSVLIDKARSLIDDLSGHVVFKEAATPYTLFKWTQNYEGAAYGWASMPRQVFVSNFMKKAFFSNLYLVGHWTTVAHGIRGVVYNGLAISDLILKKEKKR
ncbi:phytoene desaturase family protein [Candidatus Omnitrophota bacterium]